MKHKCLLIGPNTVVRYGVKFFPLFVGLNVISNAQTDWFVDTSCVITLVWTTDKRLVRLGLLKFILGTRKTFHIVRRTA